MAQSQGGRWQLEGRRGLQRPLALRGEWQAAWAMDLGATCGALEGGSSEAL